MKKGGSEMNTEPSKSQERETAHAVSEPTAAYGYHSQTNTVEYYWNQIKDANHDIKLSLIGKLSDSILDEMYYVPNAETVAAIEEARAGKYAGTADLSSLEAFIKSCE